MSKTTLKATNRRPRVALELEEISSCDATQDEIEEWKTDAEIYAQLLRNPSCPESFREAFVSIFTEHLLMPCVAEGVPEIRALFQIAVLSLQSQIPADALRVVEVLRTLRETLAPELTEKVMAGLKGGRC